MSIVSRLTFKQEHFRGQGKNTTVVFDAKIDIGWADLADRFKIFVDATTVDADISEVVIKFKNGSEVSSKDIKTIDE